MQHNVIPFFSSVVQKTDGDREGIENEGLATRCPSYGRIIRLNSSNFQGLELKKEV